MKHIVLATTQYTLDETHRTNKAFLSHRIYGAGVHTIFGVPGDFTLGFHELLEKRKEDVQFVGVCNEESAGFAADSYARLRGIGACLATYCVGGLKLLNAAACASAERVPVVFIVGAPGAQEKLSSNLVHHTFQTYNSQAEIFKNVMRAENIVVLTDLSLVASQIDQVLHQAYSQKRPVFIELPRDMVYKQLPINNNMFQKSSFVPPPRCIPANIEAAAKNIHNLCKKANSIVIICGVEVSRFRLQADVVRFASAGQLDGSDGVGISIATTLLAKSCFSDDHPLSLGLYEGYLGNPDTQHTVESADLVIMLGVIMADSNFRYVYVNVYTDTVYRHIQTLILTILRIFSCIHTPINISIHI